MKELWILSSLTVIGENMTETEAKELMKRSLRNTSADPVEWLQFDYKCYDIQRLLTYVYNSKGGWASHWPSTKVIGEKVCRNCQYRLHFAVSKNCDYHMKFKGFGEAGRTT